MIQLLLMTVLSLFASDTADLPAGCEYNKECLQESPGSFCGDGSASYFTLTVRPEAKNLLIYLQGGGACWDFTSCTGGFAQNLTRILPNNDWNGGQGILNAKSQANPFRSDTVVTVPYCTGDVFSGTKEVEYVSGRLKKKVKHHGYKNMLLMLDRIKSLYPHPERVVLIGASAGGMGVIRHLKNVTERYPATPIYVLSDGGVPFKPPYVYEASYKKIMNNWGAELEHSVTNLSELVEENSKQYPDVRFGIIASYFDYVMTFFATSVGSPAALKAVKGTLIELSDHHIGLQRPNQRVFYLDDVKHVYLTKDFEKISSDGNKLSEWLKAMVSGQEQEWKNVRPDLYRDLVNSPQ